MILKPPFLPAESLAWASFSWTVVIGVRLCWRIYAIDHVYGSRCTSKSSLGNARVVYPFCSFIRAQRVILALTMPDNGAFRFRGGNLADRELPAIAGQAIVLMILEHHALPPPTLQYCKRVTTIVIATFEAKVQYTRQPALRHNDEGINLHMPSRCSGAFISPGECFRGAVDFFLSVLDARTRGGEEHFRADR